MRSAFRAMAFGAAFVIAAGCARPAPPKADIAPPRSVRAALPAPNDALKRSAAKTCLGAHTDVKPRYDGQQPDAFASSGPGTADVSVYVNTHGKPVAAMVLSASSTSYAAAAINIVAAWSFTPATCENKPILSTYEVRMQ